MTKVKTLLASDMDGTLIPLEKGPEREAEIVEFREAVAAAPGLILAYVTGRGFKLAQKGIREWGLPQPDFFVGDVGTSLYRANGDGFEVDPDYEGRMREALGGLDFQEVEGFMGPVAHLLNPPREEQTPFKLSYHLPRDGRHMETVIRVREHLEGLGGRVHAVFSVGAPSGTPLLDLLPAGAGKDFALRYLQEVTGVDDDGIVYAGDSGNDKAALLAGFRGIVVANADETLKAEITALEEEGALAGQIHFSPHPFVRGVVEGCRHFGIL